MIDPRADGKAPHQPGVAGLQQFGRRRDVLLDDPPKVGQPIDIEGVQRKVTRVVKNRFMDQPPTFSIEVE
jgi:hypothetical protein